MSYEAQKDVEHLYSRKNIKKAIMKEIKDSPEIMEKLAQGVTLLEQYRDTPYSYESKNVRVQQLHTIDLAYIVEEVACVTLLIQEPVQFTQVVGELAGTLGFSNKGDGIKTIAEILAVLCETDLFEIMKDDKYASLTIVSNFGMPEKLGAFIKQTKFLPPMICPPRKVRTNYDSGYLTKKESLILGNGNFHEGDICLDSINRFNQIPLSLDTELLKTYSEPPLDFDTPEKRTKWETTHPGESWEMELQDRKDKWTKMVTDSYKVYVDLVHQGNEFWITHKVDKRGRTYSQGYHCSTQGNSFRKAIINFHEKELITGDLR